MEKEEMRKALIKGGLFSKDSKPFDPYTATEEELANTRFSGAGFATKEEAEEYFGSKYKEDHK